MPVTYGCTDDWTWQNNEGSVFAILARNPKKLVAQRSRNSGGDLPRAALFVRFHIVNHNGRIEKSVSAHQGACLTAQWGPDGAGLLTAGEDGFVKVWSRNGLLRSTIVQSDAPCYSTSWSPDSGAVVYAKGDALVIKQLNSSDKVSQWKAHDGLILCLAWNPNNNLIVSGAEDGFFKIWDPFSQLISASVKHDHPITSVCWAPAGDLLAVGSFNLIRLCNAGGWSHCLDRPSSGSVYSLGWSSDGTQLAAACANGHVLFAHIIDREYEWNNYACAQTARKVIAIRNILNDQSDLLDYPDRVIQVALGFGYMVVATVKQCFIHKLSSWNTPVTCDLKEGTISMILISESAASAIAPILTNIFNEILMFGCIPTDWMKSTIVLLHKKGEKGDINNYIPISLMSNIYKVFSKIILSRIAVTLDENQPKEQAGFCGKFSTIDHIHVRQVLQKYQEYNKTYYIGCVDFQKAFDSLEHEYIWKALRCQGVQMKYIRTLSTIYSGSTAEAKLEATGEPFSIQRGVRQGDPISPKLFSVVLEMIFRNLEWEYMGLNINGEKLNHLRFADDLILFSENSKGLEKMLQQLSDESEKAGLTMNLSKTKIMTNAEPTDLDTVRVNNEEIELVTEYIYLGQLISPTNTMNKEIDRRITNTWKKYWSLSEIMKNKEMSLKSKRIVYNMCILPCLTYGCQTWALTQQLSNKIKVCQNSIERSVVGVKRKDRVNLEKIKNKTKFKNAHSVCKKLKWRWTGHMLREKKEKWTRLITEWYPRGNKRSKGRQHKRWEDDIKQIAGAKWTRIARDRETWKSLEEAFVAGQAVTNNNPIADDIICMCIVERSSLSVYSYMGRLLASPRWSGMRPESLGRAAVSLGPDVLAVVDHADKKGDSSDNAVTKITHKMTVATVALCQTGPSNERQLALLDSNRDLYVVTVKDNKMKCLKLGSQILSVVWSAETDLLVGLRANSVVAWCCARAANQPDWLSLTTVCKEVSDLGRNPILQSVYEGIVHICKGNGSLLHVSLVAFQEKMLKHVAANRWEAAVQLCRTVEDDNLWACLAVLAWQHRQLAVAEEAFALIRQYHQVSYIQHLRVVN
ncbi:Intraflagellar transport protein 80 homolog [Eumeta japonica]|uniref:Intraflagellar transport protein 80 homolog n=1 Tax=Eumeta variegata TaxID=151549 RepID=A0A4C1Z4Y5_EUMVA|nr:Intraflagellar transport protein 80 homolog [Eumeta japonica]